MKIFIPLPVRDIGGTSIFAKKFAHGMRTRGHEVVFERPGDYDILFVIVTCLPHHLVHAKIHGKKVAHRLDGTYYWSVASWRYPFYNFPAKIVRKFFADLTIVQSAYSKRCVQKFLGWGRAKKEVLVYNGVDLEHFTPNGPRTDELRANQQQEIFFTASKFRRKDQILPLIAAMRIYQEEYNTNSKLCIAGSFSRHVRDVPKEYASLPYLSFLGKIDNAHLADYLRSVDVFVSTHLNPPCPNNILEAMASGLPIGGVADGAMTELTEDGKNSLLIPADGDAFWKERNYDTGAFAKNMHTLVQNKEKFGAASRTRAENDFSLYTMLDHYESALTDLLNTKR